MALRARCAFRLLIFALGVSRNDGPEIWEDSAGKLCLPGSLSFPFGAVQFGYIYFGDFVRGIGWQVLGAQ
jgi:hypothetical protein